MSRFGPKRVRFIPVKDGDVVELGDTGPLHTSHYATRTPHIVIGFKPGPGPQANGWLVILVDEAVRGRDNVRPVKRRSAVS